MHQCRYSALHQQRNPRLHLLCGRQLSRMYSSPSRFHRRRHRSFGLHPCLRLFWPQRLCLPRLRCPRLSWLQHLRPSRLQCLRQFWLQHQCSPKLLRLSKLQHPCLFWLQRLHPSSSQRQLQHQGEWAQHLLHLSSSVRVHRSVSASRSGYCATISVMLCCQCSTIHCEPQSAMTSHL